jgi:hypothetical protein
VNSIPRAGLTSALSCDFDLNVYPNAPSITFVSTPGPATSAASVTVRGAGVAGYTFTLYDGAKSVGSGLVEADGTWTITVSLKVGDHSLSATQTASIPYQGKFTSENSAELTRTVYAPPSAPTVVSAPANVLAGAAFVVRGRGAAGNTVTVFDGLTQVGTGTVGADGYWNVTVVLTGAGLHTLKAQQLHPVSGFTGAFSSSFLVRAYDQPAPPVISSVSPPALTSATTPVTVTGTGVVGQTLTLYDGTVAIKTVVVGALGTWSATVNLAVGDHVLSATQSPAAGIVSAASAPFVVTVSSPPPPAAPHVTSAPATASWGQLFAVRGVGIAGHKVSIYDGATLLGTSTVAADGTWVVNVRLYSLGNRTLTAKQQSPTTGLWSLSNPTFVVRI